MIVFFLSFTASSQLDSLHCFTTPQVQQFLYTKVELELCLSQYDNIVTENDSLLVSNSKLHTEVDNTKKKLKRTRGVAIGTGGGAIILLVLLVLL